MTNFSAFTKQVLDHESSFKGPKILDKNDGGMMMAIGRNRMSEMVPDEVFDGSSRMSDFSSTTLGIQMISGASPSIEF